MRCRELDTYFQNLVIFLRIFCEYFENFYCNILGIFWEFMGNFWGNFCGVFFLRILCGNCQWIFTFLKVNRFFTFSNSADCLHFQSQLIVYIVKVRWFLHSTSHLITKRYLKYGRILLVCQDFGFLSRFCLKAEEKF